MQDGKRGPRHGGDLPETAVRVGAAQVEGQERVWCLFETRGRPGRRMVRQDASWPTVHRRRQERVIWTRARLILLSRLHCSIDYYLYPIVYSVNLTTRVHNSIMS